MILVLYGFSVKTCCAMLHGLLLLYKRLDKHLEKQLGLETLYVITSMQF